MVTVCMTMARGSRATGNDDGEVRHEVFRRLHLGTHALVRNAALVEDLAFRLKPVCRIERHDCYLGVQDTF